MYIPSAFVSSKRLLGVGMPPRDPVRPLKGIRVVSSQVVRYYPNFPKAFATFRQLALSRGYVFNAANQTVPLSKPAMRSAVEAAKDCGELYAALNCGDCWLCTPCERTYSGVHPPRPLDST